MTSRGSQWTAAAAWPEKRKEAGVVAAAAADGSFCLTSKQPLSVNYNRMLVNTPPPPPPLPPGTPPSPIKTLVALAWGEICTSGVSKSMQEL